MRTSHNVHEVAGPSGRISDPGLLILAALERGPKHGHAMRTYIADSYGNKIGQGALYGAIERLEKKGWIQALANVNRRKPYQITPAGLTHLQLQLKSLQRLSAQVAVAATAVSGPRAPSPSYYLQQEEQTEIDSELNLQPVKVYNVDSLPFQQLGGRRFEILAYLLQREEHENSIVSLMKASQDKGRDVLVHQGGQLAKIIQCKNLANKLGEPTLWDELLKLCLHDHIEQFIPPVGIDYELWAPEGLTEAADRIVTNWPNSIDEISVKKAFNRLVKQFKGLANIEWSNAGSYCVQTLSSRIRLQRLEKFSLSQIVRESPEIFSRFFEATLVMKEEQVERYLSPLKDIQVKIESLTDHKQGDEIDEEINEARDLINLRNFADASVLLRRIQSKKHHRLTKYQRYRITANLGSIAVGEGNVNEAARLFLDAYSLEPEDEKARTNEVFAYFLQGKTEKTFSLASKRLEEYPLSKRLASLWITTAPLEMPIESLVSELEDAVLADPEVSAALARRALGTGDLLRAKQYLSDARRSDQNWHQVWVLDAAMAICEVVWANAGVFLLTPQERATAISRGLESANRALSLCDSKWARAEALTARSELHFFEGQTESAIEDAREARKIDPKNINTMQTLAQALLSQRSIDEGIEVLKAAIAIDARADIAFMLARALAARGKDGDLRCASELASKVDLRHLPPAIRPVFLIGMIEVIAKALDFPRAEALLSSSEELLARSTTMTIRAFLAGESGKRDEARSIAQEASKLASTGSDVATKDFLAQVLVEVGEPALALPLFEELFESQIPSFDANKLIDCAARLQLDHKVMEYCDVIYRRSGCTWDRLQFELQYLEKYDKPKAINRIQEFLKAAPGHKLAQLRLSLIGYQQRIPELIKASVRDLPTVEELTDDYLVPTLGIMRYGEDHDLAIDFAYRYLRLHFDSQTAHEAYIQTVLRRRDDRIEPEEETVRVGSAVLCAEVPSGGLRWFVIEDTEKPMRDFEEISTTDPIAMGMLGKRVGEKFLLAKAEMGNREATIQRIIPKYVRRFQDCGNELQVRFTRSTMLQSVAIPSGNQIVQPAISALTHSFQKRAEAFETLRSLYADQPLSLHVYGSRFGHNAYEGLMHIALTDGMDVKCFEGDRSEIQAAMSILREQPTLLVDLPAIATIRLLGLERIFISQHFRFAMTQGTWEELNHTLRDDDPRGQQAGSIGYEQGRLFFREEDAESTACRKAADAAFLDGLRGAVEVVPSHELAKVEPKNRELLEGYLGTHGAETIVVSGRKDLAVWTDDSTVGRLAQGTYGARRVWSQVVLLALTEANVIAQDEYSCAVAKLLGFGYRSTFFDSRVILEAARLAEFRTGRFPLKQVLSGFQYLNLPGTALVKEFISLFRLLHNEPTLDQYKQLIVHAFLDSLWRNPATHDFVFQLRSQSAAIFGLDVSAEHAFNKCFDEWKKLLNRYLRI